MHITRERVVSTVAFMSAHLSHHVTRTPMAFEECSLRRELIACILSSRVRSESVELAMSRLASAGLMEDHVWNVAGKQFEEDVFDALRGRGEGPAIASGSYRFPRVGAKRLSDLREALRSEPLTARLLHADDSIRVRRSLVAALPGVGPKQASMFLRNIGISYDLAILDVHVVRFMRSIKLLTGSRLSLGRMNEYESIEVRVRKYSHSIGVQPGYLDWAIWVTMKALSEIRQ